ncbi:hypothetical protein ACO1O0_001055 [Amphichorda felina]
MSAPISQFSRLSLENMPPTTRSKSRAVSVTPAPNASNGCYGSDTESSVDSETDSDLSDYDEDAPAVVRSPSRLLYRLDGLPARSRNAVRDAFSDPPRISLQRCRLINDTYAFQMTELVTRSVRIRASGDGESHLSCSCTPPTNRSGEHQETCPHLLWLLDQLLKQTLYHHDRNEPVTMKRSGYAHEMGDPFQSIARHHLDVLAAGIHCPLVDPDSDGQLDQTRTLEARELLSSIYSMPPDQFRPDIFDHPTLGRKVLKRNDLDRTVFRMLTDNGHFFHYLLSLSRPTDPVNDPFRKLSQRIDLVLRSLDAAAAAAQTTPPVSPSGNNNSSSSSSSSSSSGNSASVEHPTTVAWAARHILGCVNHIRSALYSRDHPLRPSEALSAASALVHILAGVVERTRDIQREGPRLDRNLYLRLVGDRDQDFVIGVLALIPGAASQFLSNLEELLDEIGVHGAPATYVDKFRSLLGRLRTSRTGAAGLKRQGQGQAADRRSKRMK